MKRTLLSALSLILLLGAVAAYAADDATDAVTTPAPGQVVYDAHTAFTFLKSMAGSWEGAAKEHDHHATAQARAVEVRTSAAGSAVIQTLYPGAPHEMLNVFHMDGDTLLFTHYCAAQNAPVMKFEATDVPGEIKFVFNGGTNFDPAVDVHAHEGSFQVKDKDTVGSSFITWAGGKPQPMLEGVMVRKTAG
jgi:hypothetical protein